MTERQALRAGPLRCALENGALRWITVTLPDGSEREVVRGVYAAVRDRNWGTPAPRFTRYDVEARGDSFTVRITAEHVAGDIDLVWEGAIDGTAEGSISFTMDATARSTFLRNRLGFCVLHPMEAAGTDVEVEHPDGTVERGVFPVEISPHQPFFEIAALWQRVRGVTVEVRFEGEVFEMEDQRNWTDASYKTYCTPLARPFPVEVPAGSRIWQRVSVRAAGDAAGGPEGRAGAASKAPERPPREAREALRPPAVVRVGDRHLGALPEIGLQVASHGGALTGREIDLLSSLNPSHLWLTLHLTRPDWERRLMAAHQEAQHLLATLEIEAICGDSGAGIDGLAATVAAHGIPVSAVHVYPKTSVVTSELVMRRAREVFRATHPRGRLHIQLGGGSRADFVNVNRATLPLDLMDFVAYAVNPQVHAFDNSSIVETLAAQTVVLENAKRLARGRPVRVGPLTLRQRINPAATAAESELTAGELPPNVDPRQPTLFAAGWLLGCIRRSSRAAALTLFETTGRLGLIEQTDGFVPHPAFPSVPGATFPAYDVLAAIAERGEDEMLPIEAEPAGAVEALALRGPDSTRLLIANLLDDQQIIRVEGIPLAGATIRRLAADVAIGVNEPAAGPLPAPPGTLDVEHGTLRLPPYAIAILTTLNTGAAT